MIYSGSSFEFSEFRIKAKVLDPCGSGNNLYFLSIFGKLKFNQKEESINYLTFSISYYSPTVHTVQNSRNVVAHLIARQTSGAEVPGSNPASPTMILVRCIFPYCGELRQIYMYIPLYIYIYFFFF